MSRRRKTDDIPMRRLNQALEEDEHGYVYPAEDEDEDQEEMEESEHHPNDRTSRKVARNVVIQLPSRNIDDLLTTGAPTDTATDGATLRLGLPRRSDSVYRSVRLKSALLNGQQLNASEIYQVLTKEGDMSPEEMRNTLKEMRQTLSIKKDLKRLLDRDEEIRRQSRGVDWATRMKYRLGMKWQHFKYDLRDLSYSLELWHRHLKVIQGKFGTGVASYFIFLRWLLYLNIFSFIIMLGFLVAPELIYERDIPSHHANSTLKFGSYDILTGSGWFRDSVLYYGDYTNSTIKVLWNLEYHMPLAYLLTFGVFALTNLVIVAVSLAKSYQENYIGGFGDTKSVFVNKVFCAWDYSIETKNAASLQKRSIFNDLKESLSAELEIEIEQSTKTKLLNGSICLFVNIVVLSLIGLVGACVHLMLGRYAALVEVTVISQMELPVIVTAVSCISYPIFHFIGKFEFFFSKVTRLYLTMGRCVLLKLVVLCVILSFWMMEHIPNAKKNQCYETDIGEEIYRLTVVNFIFTFILGTVIGEVLRKYFYQNVSQRVGHPEFDIAHNTLDIIYYQTLLWLGTFYSPLLSVVVLAIYVLQFYIKRYSVSMNCTPSEKPWCASHTQTVFLGLAFLNFIVSIIAVGYNIWRIAPSATCGPFRNLANRYDIVLALFPSLGEGNPILSEILEYATSAGVIAAVITALCVVVYYVRAQSLGHANMVRLIHEQLVLEGKDKVFLLKLFNEALEHKNGSTPSNVPGTSGLAAHTPTPEEKNNGRWCEIVNEVYKDYYHGITTASPTSHNAFVGKYDPGYMPAAVPTNNISPDYSDSDSISSRENVRRDNHRPSLGSASYDSDSDKKSHRMPRALSPKSRNYSSSSDVIHASQSDIHSPTRKGARRSADPFPRPVHQPAFQYLARGETPPKINTNKSSNSSIPSRKGKI